jgi:hypothetical protein
LEVSEFLRILNTEMAEERKRAMELLHDQLLRHTVEYDPHKHPHFSARVFELYFPIAVAITTYEPLQRHAHDHLGAVWNDRKEVSE